jgi:MFS family permease
MEHIGAVLSRQQRQKGFLGLYFGRVVMTVSGALMGIFLPIFLYNLFNKNIHAVMLYYLIGCLVYMLLLPFGIQFLNKFGFRKSLIVATLAAALMYVAYYFTNSTTALYLIPLSLFSLIAFRLFFWVPYHVDFAMFTRTKKRGGQIGLMLATLTLLGVVGPIIAGYLIVHFGMSVLFAISVVVFVLGIIPFSMVPRTNEAFAWTYGESFRQLFLKKNRAVVLSSIAGGADDVLGVVVWPIFIFILLQGDYFKVGALSSFIAGATVFLQFSLGHYLDKIGNKNYVLKIGSVLYALGWVIKIFVATAFQVFIAGLYHKFTQIFTDTSFDTIFYEMAADQGHYIDEFTLLSEVALQVGKIIALVAISVIALYVGIQWAFAIGILSALYLNALYALKEDRVVV